MVIESQLWIMQVSPHKQVRQVSRIVEEWQIASDPNRQQRRDEREDRTEHEQRRLIPQTLPRRAKPPQRSIHARIL